MGRHRLQAFGVVAEGSRVGIAADPHVEGWPADGQRGERCAMDRVSLRVLGESALQSRKRESDFA